MLYVLCFVGIQPRKSNVYASCPDQTGQRFVLNPVDESDRAIGSEYRSRVYAKVRHNPRLFRPKKNQPTVLFIIKCLIMRSSENSHCNRIYRQGPFVIAQLLQKSLQTQTPPAELHIRVQYVPPMTRAHRIFRHGDPSCSGYQRRSPLDYRYEAETKLLASCDPTLLAVLGMFSVGL